MAQKIAADQNYVLGSWAIAAAVPGLICFILVPMFFI
jgi:hypothetical protein